MIHLCSYNTKVSSVLLCYILVSHGAKYLEHLESNPCSRIQVSNLKFGAENIGQDVEKLRFTLEYARKHEGLSDLPVLKRLLEQLEEKDLGALVMDNVERLFRTCSQSKRKQFINELSPYAGRIFSLRHMARLDQMKSLYIAFMAFGRDIESLSFPTARTARGSKRVLQKQTSNARLISAHVRSKGADTRAKALNDIRSELSKGSEIVTLSQVAREANRRGLLTERKTPWSSSKVGRQLRRLSKPENEGSD